MKLTREQATILSSMSPDAVKALHDLAVSEQAIITESIMNPANPRDLDQYLKGGFMAWEDIKKLNVYVHNTVKEKEDKAQ